MASFTVLGYQDPFTELYVSYCYELNIVGSGHTQEESFRDLGQLLDSFVSPSQAIAPGLQPQQRRKDIESMFTHVVFSRPPRDSQLTTSSDHSLDLYCFPQEWITELPFDEKAREKEFEAYLRSLDDFKKPEPMCDDDIPF